MQKFKIDNFLRENPGMAPPSFVPLTDAAVNELVETLLINAGCPAGVPKDVLRELSANATPVTGVNLEQEELELQVLFGKSGINPGPVLYVEWGAMREIDRFQTADLNRHFYHVWYPGADDIEIFDDSLTWLMFVRHYGSVHVWRPSV